MTEENYTTIRSQLVREFWFMKSKRLYMSARARIRKIAALDFEMNGIPKEKTLAKFHYNDIKAKIEESQIN